MQQCYMVQVSVLVPMPNSRTFFQETCLGLQKVFLSNAEHCSRKNFPGTFTWGKDWNAKTLFGIYKSRSVRWRKKKRSDTKGREVPKAVKCIEAESGMVIARDWVIGGGEGGGSAAMCNRWESSQICCMTVYLTLLDCTPRGTFYVMCFVPLF